MGTWSGSRTRETEVDADYGNKRLIALRGKPTGKGYTICTTSEGAVIGAVWESPTTVLSIDPTPVPHRHGAEGK